MTMLSFGRLILVFLFLSPLTAAQHEMYSDSTYACGTEANYTSDSLFGTNLRSILSNMTSHNDAGLNGFNRFSEGAGDGTAFAYALCRGDTDRSICSGCVQKAANQILLHCQNQRAGIIWSNNCMLAYGEYYLYLPRQAPLQYAYFYTLNQGEIVNPSYWDSYQEARKELLANLARKASLGDFNLKFAVGEASYTETEKIYALVQCVPQLDKNQCGQCLELARNITSTSYSNYLSVRILQLGCDCRVSYTKFYENAVETTPSPPLVDASRRSPDALDAALPPPSSQSSKGKLIQPSRRREKVRQQATHFLPVKHANQNSSSDVPPRIG